MKQYGKRILSLLLAFILLLGTMSTSVMAAPAADIPAEMLDNVYLDAIAYTGYKVQAQKDAGTIFVQFGSRAPASVRSNITYGTGPSGLETVASGGTATGLAPSISTFESGGLCCASYVSYVYYNYMPNIAGIDTSATPRPSNPRLAAAYNDAANSWVAAGTARRIAFTQSSDGSTFTPAENIPIGSLIIYHEMGGTRISHVAIYAGYYNGNHFVTHVGNSRGPEFITVTNSSKGDSPNVVQQVVAPNFVEDNGTIEVYKKDTDGNNLAGAVFVATSTTDSSKQYVIGPTNASGYAYIERVPYGDYVIRETVFPTNYRSYGQTEWRVTVSTSNNGVAAFHSVNEIIPGSIKIVKISEDGKVDNITFTISGNGANHTVTTGQNGEVQLDELKPGVYTVTESSYDKYEPQEVRRVTVVTGQVTTVSFNNVLKRGDLRIVKSSEDGLEEGMTFHLYGTSLAGIPVDEYAVTDADGIAIFKDVLISGQSPYTVEEVNTPIRYVVPEEQTAPVYWKEVTQREFTNILKKFKVTVTKSDKEKGLPQGDATLKGAVYGIYKGATLVDSYETDENGQFTSKEYVCDYDWTVREITPSEGYLLDKTVHKVGAEPERYTIEHNLTANDVTEQVIKGTIAIIKHTDDGKTQIETPEQGAEFEVFLKRAGSYEKAKKTERDILVCDELGFACTKKLPYGVYTVKQTKGWEGRELMEAFDVYISQDGKEYSYLINNANFESYIKVVKTDAETGKTIPYAGAGFQIYRPDGSRVEMTFTYPQITTIDTFYTAEDGTLVTPEKLPYGKGYLLVEVQAPFGYVLDKTPLAFDVKAEDAYREGSITLVKVQRPDMPQKGTITITKSGEVFSSVVADGEVYQPVYEVQNLKGAIFEVRAAEDISTPDGTIRYRQGELVDTIETTADGTATTQPLYLGKYEIHEIQAPINMVLNGEIIETELVYAGQEIEITTTSASIYNERQKVELSLLKLLEKDDKFHIGEKDEILCVKFGLFAAKELIAGDGTSIPKDGLLEIATCDKDGKITFKTDVPVGAKLYVQELETDAHYQLTDTKFYVEFAYAGQDTAIVHLTFNQGDKIENKLIRGSILGKKVDEDGNVLKGVMFGLFKKDETEFTNKNAILISKTDADGLFGFEEVAYGTWIVKELKTLPQYVLDETAYEVTIGTHEEVIEMTIVNKFITGTLEITKSDLSTGKLLANVGFRIRNEKGEIVEEGYTDDKGIAKFTLRYGKYTYQEFSALEGYILDEKEYPFEIKEDGQIIKAEMKNELIPLSPKTGDETATGFWMGLGAIALGGIISTGIVCVKRKKADDES